MITVLPHTFLFPLARAGSREGLLLLAIPRPLSGRVEARMSAA
jgi:hypothetical protein